MNSTAILLKLTWFGLVLASLASLTGCGGGGGDGTPNPPPPPDPVSYTIRVNSVGAPATATLRVFAEVSVSWQLTPSRASTTPVTFSVTSSTANVSIVNGSGSVSPNTAISTTLRYKCSAVGEFPIVATLSAAGISQEVSSTAMCTEEISLQIFQGPLIGSFLLLRDSSGWETSLTQVNYHEAEQLRFAPNRTAFVTVVSEHSETEAVSADLSFDSASAELTVESISLSFTPPNTTGTRPNYITQEVFLIEDENLLDEGNLTVQVNSTGVSTEPTSVDLNDLANKRLPHFNLVIVPIKADHGALVVTDLDLDEIENAIRDTLPLADVSIRVREQLDLTGVEWDFNVEMTPLDHLLELWIDESSRNEFYHGYYKDVEGSNLCGIALLGVNVGMSKEVTSSCTIYTIAHEIGHNFDLRHAPGCGAEDSNPDPDFPYSDGSIGTESGWFMRHRRSVGSEAVTAVKHFDLMSYCDNRFVSQYSYGRAFDYWADKVTTPIVAKLRTPIGELIDAVKGKSWAITGRVSSQGEWSFRRMKVVDNEPHQFTVQPSSYLLTIQDATHGQELHKEYVNPAPILHGREGVSFWGSRLPYYQRDDLILLVHDEKGNLLAERQLEDFSYSR